VWFDTERLSERAISQTDAIGVANDGTGKVALLSIPTRLFSTAAPPHTRDATPATQEPFLDHERVSRVFSFPAG
jgi:hypothetical protein